MNCIFDCAGTCPFYEMPCVWGITRGTRRSYPMHPGCKITLNGDEVKMSALRQGDLLTIDGQPAIAIRATRS